MICYVYFNNGRCFCIYIYILFLAEQISEYILWTRDLEDEHPNKFVDEIFQTNILIYSDIKKGTKQIFNY